MTAKTYRTLSILALIVSVIGLLSFFQNNRSVNLGAFLFPLLLSGFFYYHCRRAKKNSRAD